MRDYSADDILDAIKKADIGFPGDFRVLQPKAFVGLVNRSQKYLAAQFGIKADQFRPLDVSQLEAFLSLAEKQSSLTLVMRHGQQQVSEAIKKLEPAQKKVAMVQPQNNLNDAITLASCVELYAHLMTIAYIRAKTGFNVIIESSINKRASQPAETIAEVLQTEQVTYKSRWDCVNYPDNDAMSNNNLYQYLNNGSLPWLKENVDAVVSEGTYDSITNQMFDMIGDALLPNTIRLVITHSQQTQALCEALGLSEERLLEFGFMAWPNAGHAKLFRKGFFADKTVYELSKQTMFAEHRTEHHDRDPDAHRLVTNLKKQVKEGAEKIGRLFIC